LDAVEQVLAAGQLLEQAGDVEERGLARARWTGHGDELAVADLQREIAQRVGLDHLGPVHLGDVLHVKHGHGFLTKGSVAWASYSAIRTRWAVPKLSAPVTTIRSPGLAPDTISTASRLIAPVRIGRRSAMPSSTKYAVLPPPVSRNGPRSTLSTPGRSSIRI